MRRRESPALQKHTARWGEGTPQRQVRGAGTHIGQLKVRVAPGTGAAASSGRSEHPIWETGKVNLGIQRRNTHRTSPRRGPCQEVSESVPARTGAVMERVCEREQGLTWGAAKNLRRESSSNFALPGESQGWNTVGPSAHVPWQPLHPPAFPPQEAAPGTLGSCGAGLSASRRKGGQQPQGSRLGPSPRQRRMRLQEHSKTWPQVMGNL